MSDSGLVAVAEIGGLYGINVETLTGDKTLTPGTDKMYQYLDEGGADRVVTLAIAGAKAGDRFVIRHNGAYGDSYYLWVKQGAINIDFLYAGSIHKYIFDGTNWVPEEMGSGENDNKYRNTAIGRNAKSYNEGVGLGNAAESYSGGTAVGNQALGHTYGAAIGDHAFGYSDGAALGYYAVGTHKGIGLGRHSNSGDLEFAHAIGYYSSCYRVAETSINIDGATEQKNNVVQGRWARETLNATPVEMFCGGKSNQRFLIRPSSVLAFRMIITARDNVANEVAMYTVDDGLIKRDAANNTVLVAGTVVVVHEDDATWDVTVTADDVNVALIITVTGDGTNPTQWAAVLEGVETHF